MVRVLTPSQSDFEAVGAKESMKIGTVFVCAHVCDCDFVGGVCCVCARVLGGGALTNRCIGRTPLHNQRGHDQPFLGDLGRCVGCRGGYQVKKGGGEE